MVLFDGGRWTEPVLDDKDNRDKTSSSKRLTVEDDILLAKSIINYWDKMRVIILILELILIIGIILIIVELKYCSTALTSNDNHIKQLIEANTINQVEIISK